MKKVIELAFVGLLLLGPTESISGQGSRLIATDHAPAVRVGTNIMDINWLISKEAENPCLGHPEGCSMEISQFVAGGKATVFLNLNEDGVIEEIIVTGE